MRWIGSWGELVSLCRVAHGQQWSTGDCQYEDDNDDDDQEFQDALLGRPPTSESALAVALRLPGVGYPPGPVPNSPD